jgi:hypothetical protein
MKKHLLTSAAMLLGLAALAAPAAADVTVRGYIDKDVDIDVIEVLVKVKAVTITVTRNFTGGQSAAEATGVHDQRTTGNVYRRDCAANVCTTTTSTTDAALATQFPVGPGGLVAVVDASFTGNVGLVLWNQDVGVFSNQANIVTAAVTGGRADFAEAYDAADQRTQNNQSFVTGFLSGQATPTSPATVSASITNSVKGNVGVTMLNQNAGVASNQYNSLTLAFGLDGSSVALAEADLGQWNTNNFTFSVATIRSATISNSIDGNIGVTTVNQNVGNFNNQATKISVSGGL